ncbi:MAG: hypothetical protein JST83_06775 [Bacteroidetes bacterium]|nr:hypothetical protein [Bacteroidota bacterium]
MNSKIIKGTVRVGLSKAVKKWASITGNRTLYVEALAGELMGRGQRQYGRILDTRDDLMSAGRKQLKKTNKTLMKQMKKVRKSDTVKNLNKALSQGAEKLHIPAPVLATAAVAVVALLV